MTKKDVFSKISPPNHHEIPHLSWLMNEWGNEPITEFSISKVDFEKFADYIKNKKQKVLFERYGSKVGTANRDSIAKIVIVSEKDYDWGYFICIYNQDEDSEDVFPPEADNFSIVCPIEYKVRIQNGIVKKVHEAFLIPKRKEKSFKLITRNMHGLHLHDGPIPECNIDLALNYGDDFLPKDSIVEDFIASNESGIMLFHGEPGTGKSFYLKHLVQKSQRDIIFLPNQMIDALTTPDFAEFMLRQKNKTLLIEDAEDVLLDRKENRFSAGVSNILNLTDGLLGDAIKLKIICTFNMDIKDIDKAMMRKGRLKLIHQFKALKVDYANRLLERLSKDLVTDVPMTLANIYNYGTETGAELIEPKRAMGFT